MARTDFKNLIGSAESVASQASKAAKPANKTTAKAKPAKAADKPANKTTAKAKPAKAADKPAGATSGGAPQRSGAIPYTELHRKEIRFREDQIDALADLTRRLNRSRRGGHRITDATLVRLATDLLLAQADSLTGATEEELAASVRLR